MKHRTTEHASSPNSRISAKFVLLAALPILGWLPQGKDLERRRLVRPADVHDLRVVKRDGHRVDLAWNPSTDPDGIEVYVVKVSTDGPVTNETYDSLPDLDVAADTSFSCDVPALGTYCFGVKARNLAGIESGNVSSPASPGSDCVSVSDTTPPRINYFWANRGDQQNWLHYSATDPSRPDGPSDSVRYTVLCSRSLTRLNSVIDPEQLPSTVEYVVHDDPKPASGDDPYVQPGLTNGTAYYYRLWVIDAQSNSVTSGDAIACAPEVPTLSFTMGPEELVFDWTTDHCVNLDLPDVPARALRLPTGELVLASSDAPNDYLTYGMDFSVGTIQGLHRSCAVALASNASPSPPHLYDLYTWIYSIYLTPLSRVYALLHHEDHDPSGPPYCGTSTAPGNPCDYNSITWATSVDGHAFVRIPPGIERAAIAPPLPWSKMTMGATPYGYFTPSNIIRHTDGKYYVLFNAHIQPGSFASRMCIARTEDLDAPDPEWRAWDGTGFNLTTRAPYSADGTPSSGGQRPAATLGPNLDGGWYASVTYNTVLREYMLIGTRSLESGHCDFAVSLSTDLIHWSEPQTLMDHVHVPYNGCGYWGSGTLELYPSIIDHDQLYDPTDPNFEKSGPTFYLYFTRRNGGLDRDLKRVPVAMWVQ